MSANVNGGEGYGENLEPSGNPACVARALLALGLRLEIDASQPRAADAVRVGPGDPVPHLGPGDRARFPWAERPVTGMLPRVRVRLELEDLTTVPARILSSDEKGIDLLTPTYLGRPIPGGRIVQDARWIPQSLRNRLLSSLDGRNDRLALSLLGAGSWGSRPPESADPQDVAGLNPEQAAVVSHGLNSGITYVIGPPGTGKSKSLAALIGAAVRSGKTVACVIQSNWATDRLLDELCRSLTDRRVCPGGLSEGQVIRLGQIHLDGVEARWGGVVNPWFIADERFGASGDRSRVREEHDRLVQTCQVLVTTAAQTHLRDLRRRFDLVVMDEAAAAPLPLVYHVATLAKGDGSLVVCGDPYQLPVVTRSSHQLARRFYGQDPFRARGLVRDAALGPAVGVIKLRTQYRCDPDIASLIADPIYGGDLSTHATVFDRPDLSWPPSGASLSLLDTSGVEGNSRRVRRYGNAVHAKAIANLIGEIRSSVGGGSLRIAVLARYRDQVTTIRERIEADCLTTVSTVHAMQGAEADIVVLDLSASPEHDLLGDYLQDSAPHGVGARLLNTAITRARRRLVVVADVAHILSHPEVPPDAFVRHVLLHVGNYPL